LYGLMQAHELINEATTPDEPPAAEPATQND
jgi:hypothetical protein